MQKKSVLILALLVFFCIINLKAQDFVKNIESNFKGNLTDCFSLNNSYYFIGHMDSMSSVHLLLYKTDINGNLILKNSKLVLLSKGYKVINDNDNILIADSNKLIKYDKNFNILWNVNFQPGVNIKKLKHTRDNKYLININNSINITDTSVKTIQSTISYSDELSDFDLYNDTLYTLAVKYINVGLKNETVVSKYLMNGVKIFEKKLNLFNYSYPKYLIVNQNKEHQIASSEGKNNGYTLLLTSLNDSFNVINSVSKVEYNFELISYKYSNNSILVNWYNDKSPSNKLIQLNNSLQNLSVYNSSFYNYTDYHLTKDGDIIVADRTGSIIKFKGNINTSTNSLKLNNETYFFPNPFSEHTKFKLNNTESLNLFIYDLRGQLILSKTFISGEDLILRSSDLPNNGMYLYKIINSQSIYTGKIVLN